MTERAELQGPDRCFLACGANSYIVNNIIIHNTNTIMIQYVHYVSIYIYYIYKINLYTYIYNIYSDHFGHLVHHLAAGSTYSRTSRWCAFGTDTVSLVYLGHNKT